MKVVVVEDEAGFAREAAGTEGGGHVIGEVLAADAASVLAQAEQILTDGRIDQVPKRNGHELAFRHDAVEVVDPDRDQRDTRSRPRQIDAW